MVDRDAFPADLVRQSLDHLAAKLRADEEHKTAAATGLGSLRVLLASSEAETTRLLAAFEDHLEHGSISQTARKRIKDAVRDAEDALTGKVSTDDAKKRIWSLYDTLERVAADTIPWRRLGFHEYGRAAQERRPNCQECVSWARTHPMVDDNDSPPEPRS